MSSDGEFDPEEFMEQLLASVEDEHTDAIDTLLIGHLLPYLERTYEVTEPNIVCGDDLAERISARVMARLSDALDESPKVAALRRGAEELKQALRRLEEGHAELFGRTHAALRDALAEAAEKEAGVARHVGEALDEHMRHAKQAAAQLVGAWAADRANAEHRFEVFTDWDHPGYERIVRRRLREAGSDDDE